MDLFTKTQKILIAVCVGGFFLLGMLLTLDSGDQGPETPMGCTWIDMNPSKGSDYQLACVEGYGWDR